MAGLLGIKYRCVALVLASAVGYLALHDEKTEPEQVDRRDFYCDVVTSHGYLRRAFIRDGDKDADKKAVFRFEPSGKADHSVANYANKGNEIVGIAIDVEKNRPSGTFVATRENCTVTDHNGDTRIYALK